jgi:hypothetical protein
MHISSRLPLAPLLHAYAGRMPSLAELGRLPGTGPRCAAVLGATARFFFADFVDSASDADLGEALVRFYEACVDPPLHAAALRRRLGVVRHGLAYLLRGRDPLPAKAAGCLSPLGPYFVAGLGPAFWSALLQALSPARNPGWTSSVVAGLRRLGLARWPRSAAPDEVYAALLAAHARIRSQQPAMSALHVDHFLGRVAAMPGRDLWADTEAPDPVARAAARQRQRVPVRDRIKDRGAELARARQQLETALAVRDGAAIVAALAAADPSGAARSRFDGTPHGEELTLWVGRLWEADDPESTLAAFWEADPLPGAGLWLPTAALHLRDPGRFFPWNDDTRGACAVLSDISEAGPPALRYHLFNEAAAWLCERHGLHPLEVPAVLTSLALERGAQCAEREEAAPALRSALCAARATFRGFCADTFAFLGELAHNNRREWMERQRARYRFAVREPLVELCRALAARYVAPVLRGACGWEIDAEARNGHALTSVCKNAYGRGGPYNAALWVTFCRRRDGAQFFVRLGAEGVRFGLRLGRGSAADGARLRRNVEGHADLLFRLLRDAGALAEYRFGPTDLPEAAMEAASAHSLRTWAAGRSFEVSRSLPPDSPLLGGEELTGEVLLTFDRLLPLFACAAEEDAGPFLLRRLGAPDECFTEADFRRLTWLGDDWLRRARGLLEMKRQLILQGVPGTGKTHVARCLARLLTGGRAGAVRLVQFHPAYSYEEFVEGIKVRSVDVGGRHEVTYPVEDGLLCSLAAEAERRPSEPFVLLIDEINRGNLPRIFGELLYLLEYRGQAVELPYSRRSFRLPANVYVLGTMNAADRSVALVDQALRRRFSFLEMPPDAGVLASWLAAHVPAAGAPFADRVCSLFTRLNARLAAELGPQARVGHSYFMVPGLDEAKLRVVWQHHVRPFLEEHFAAQPARLAAFDLDVLSEDPPRGGPRRGLTKSPAAAESALPGAVGAVPQ